MSSKSDATEKCLKIHLFITLCTTVALVSGDDALPTLYEYYTGDGINSGLSDSNTYFTLNGKNITIYSGSMHYFRIPQPYWRDRLRKIRAAGLNTVETYIPWNLHEPQSGVFDFGSGHSGMEHFLDLENFLTTAQEEDLFVLVRPGPYICAEWEFGGLPSWLLRSVSSVRTSKDQIYISLVRRYFSVLLPILANYQFQNKGPIIGFQVENEFGGTGENDTEYLVELRQMFLDNGILELLFTSDSTSAGARGAIQGVLQTANFNNNPVVELDRLRAMQPDKPIMTMEYWTGWYDVISQGHSTVTAEKFKENLEAILDYPSSVNMYMFVGGTNFRFLNGANTQSHNEDNSGLRPVTTGYDYDAPITEFGAYTKKYEIVRDLISTHNKIKTKTPEPPELNPPIAYPTLELENQMYLPSLVENFDTVVHSEGVIPMELLPINNESGQSYGYTLYRKTNISIPKNGILKIKGYVRDTVLVLVNQNLVSPIPKTKADIDGFGFWRLQHSNLTISTSALENATLELLVENCGRNNYGNLDQFKQFKGLSDSIFINDEELKNWEIIPLEFKDSFLQGWLSSVSDQTTGPSLYRSSLQVMEGPFDTFIDMREWRKGVVIVNGFVVGRYFFVGPQQTLYIPAPLLVIGTNNIVIFEHYSAAESIKFSDKPIYS